jgi:hypothetical protein
MPIKRLSVIRRRSKVSPEGSAAFTRPAAAARAINRLAVRIMK